MGHKFIRILGAFSVFGNTGAVMGEGLKYFHILFLEQEPYPGPICLDPE